jgi:hypothetical protein
MSFEVQFSGVAAEAGEDRGVIKKAKHKGESGYQSRLESR